MTDIGRDQARPGNCAKSRDHVTRDNSPHYYGKLAPESREVRRGVGSVGAYGWHLTVWLIGVGREERLHCEMGRDRRVPRRLLGA